MKMLSTSRSRLTLGVGAAALGLAGFAGAGPAEATGPYPGYGSGYDRYHMPYRDCGEWYFVRWGDTLSGIADRCGTSVRALMVANRIYNPHYLKAGRYLHVPDHRYRRHARFPRLSYRDCSRCAYDTGSRHLYFDAYRTYPRDYDYARYDFDRRYGHHPRHGYDWYGYDRPRTQPYRHRYGYGNYYFDTGDWY